MREAKVRDCLQAAKKAGLEISQIIDVGIQHSTPTLMEAFPNAHHYLFEPVEEYYPIIRRNYANMSSTLVEAAVSDIDGILSLQTEKKTRGDEISHSYLTARATETTRQVPVVKLDTYFQSAAARPPFLLKIDVEGPDVPSAILRGATNVLESTSLVMIEMTVDTFMDRALILHQAGFDLWDVCDLCYYGNALWQLDAMFVKRSLKQENIKLRPMREKPFRSELWQSGFDKAS
tara:strand:- start:6905 stop:7603 length:699 start_codon:yes stop_codon:yes gene_type:complete